MHSLDRDATRVKKTSNADGRMRKNYPSPRDARDARRQPSIRRRETRFGRLGTGRRRRKAL